MLDLLHPGRKRAHDKNNSGVGGGGEEKELRFVCEEEGCDYGTNIKTNFTSRLHVCVWREGWREGLGEEVWGK